MPRPYAPEFRRRALELVESGRSVRGVAGSLGIAESCLHRWRSLDLIERGLKAPGAEFESAELAAARRRIKELEEQVKLLTKAAAAVEEVVPPRARFALVGELAAKGVSVKRACSMLGVSKSGFYASRSRAPSVRSIRHAWLTDMISAVHGASRGTYGAPRVHAELVRGHGLVVGRNTVSLLMRRAGIAGLPLRRQAKRFPATTAVEDLVRRNFRRDGPNQLWVTDITEHTTREGKLYCCAVIDAYSRRVVGWAIDSRQGADLATNALAMAIEARRQAAGAIIHADHGVQFTSWAFSERARKAGLLPSLGAVGAPYDKALVPYCTSFLLLGESTFSKAGAHLLDQARVALGRRLEEPDVLVVCLVGYEQARAVPGLDGGDVHPETACNFRDCEKATGTEAFEMARQAISAA